MTVTQLIATAAGCQAEFVRKLDAHDKCELSDAYRTWLETPEFVRILVWAGVDREELCFHAQGLLLPFPIPQVSDDPVHCWQLCRNWVWDHACMEYLRHHYPLESLLPMMLAKLTGTN